MTRMTDMLDFQAQALSLRAERQRIIAGNIANADTPGYVARDMDFAAALREATGQQADGSTMTGASLTNPAHIPLSLESTQALALKYSAPSQTNLDSNTVDMDRERASFVDNSVKYEATLRFINTDVRTLMDAMKSPSQG
ncbi:MAG TPA: flagellar basal body rod protein FlgB [Burkholderiaceae bacterium]